MDESLVPWSRGGVHWVAIILIGALVGYLGGMFGKGGSAIATPLLAAAGVPAIVAVASPLPATVPGTLVAYRRYRHLGLSDPSVIRTSLAVGIPATLLGACASHWIAGGTLLVVTDVVVALIGLRILVRGATPEDGVDDPEHRGLRLVAVAAAVGLLAGLLANAGGFLLVPLYLAALEAAGQDGAGLLPGRRLGAGPARHHRPRRAGPDRLAGGHRLRGGVDPPLRARGGDSGPHQLRSPGAHLRRRPPRPRRDVLVIR